MWNAIITLVEYYYHSDCNQWYEMSVTFGGKQAIVCVDHDVNTINKKKILKPIEKCGVGNFLGALQTRDEENKSIRSCESL